jgi:hypothetical protein
LISSNVAVAGGSAVGGGIFNTGTALIENSAIIGNTTGGQGGDAGGIASFGAATTTVVNSTVAGNICGNVGNQFCGGGISGSDTSTIVIHNTTISGNSGGIGRAPFASPLTASLQNVILAGNVLDNDSDRDCAGSTIVSLGNNSVGDLTDCVIALQPSDLVGDPGLDAFLDPDTPGDAHFPLLPTSPAIDAGSDECPATDQHGAPRAGRCDIGAIEYQPPPPNSCVGGGTSRMRGRVWTELRVPVPGATVTLLCPKGCQDTTTVRDTGHYVFRSLPSGSYVIVPQKTGCSFTPAEQTLTVAGDVTRVRFRASCIE